MNKVEKFDLTRKCKNCIHVKWVHFDPETHSITCEHFVYKNNLEYLEYKYMSQGFLRRLFRRLFK